MIAHAGFRCKVGKYREQSHTHHLRIPKAGIVKKHHKIAFQGKVVCGIEVLNVRKEYIEDFVDLDANVGGDWRLVSI
jgi:hypothetical protein